MPVVATPPTPALLLTPKQAAEVLAISPRKLWGITFEDQPALPHVRVGRLVRYAAADLSQWIDRQRSCGDGVGG